MEWRRIPKEASNRPTTGSYRDWKPHLAEEAKHQCVYCAIHDASFGGIRNFHVEHFRPRSKFVDLTDDYANLFFACAICNTFKGNDWPNGSKDNDISLAGYVNPSRRCYGDFLSVDRESHMAKSIVSAGIYMIEKLYLNRPQLILERRAAAVRARLDEHCDAEKSFRDVDDPVRSGVVNRFRSCLIDALRAYKDGAMLPRYSAADVTRP